MNEIIGGNFMNLDKRIDILGRLYALINVAAMITTIIQFIKKLDFGYIIAILWQMTALMWFTNYRHQKAMRNVQDEFINNILDDDLKRTIDIDNINKPSV